MTSRTFLWITDIHYESDTNFTDDPKRIDPQADIGKRESIFYGLYNNLAGLSHNQNLVFVGVGGDLTTGAKAKGMKKFEENLLPRLLNLVPSRPEALCIIPGNHDVAWRLDPDTPDYYEQKFATFRDMVTRHAVTTCLFPAGSGRDFKFEAHAPGPIRLDVENKTLILTINSATRCGELNKNLLKRIEAQMRDPTQAMYFFQDDVTDDVAHVLEGQLQQLEEAMEKVRGELKDAWPEYLRVAMLHHPISTHTDSRVEHRGYSHLVDAPRVQALLGRFGFHLVLTGHTHQSHAGKLRLRNGREIFVVGGLTVGGPGQDAHRGFRMITVESDRYCQVLTVKDVLNDYGHHNPQEEISNGHAERQTIHPTIESILHDDVLDAGAECEEIISCTRVTRDGDAIRSVEYRGLQVNAFPKARKGTNDEEKFWTEHQVHLPFTAGYVDKLSVHMVPENQDKHVNMTKCAPGKNAGKDFRIRFTPKVKLGRELVSFLYKWVAVNAFAQNTLQFTCKYNGEKLKSEDSATEFAYFTPDIPARRLTVLVQFPANLKLTAPARFKVVAVGQSNQKMRNWAEEPDMTSTLIERGALQYFEIFNGVGIQVKAPKPGLSFRIEWDVPTTPVIAMRENTRTIVRKAMKRSDGLVQRALEHRLYVIVDYLRRSFLKQGDEVWRGRLDATVMVFDGRSRSNELTHVASIQSFEDFKKAGTFTGVRNEVKLKVRYGEGICGRTLKQNRIQVWKAPELLEGSEPWGVEPNYYIKAGPPYHQALICFPLHCPAYDLNVDRGVYKRTEPYGVLSIGTDEDWPAEFFQRNLKNIRDEDHHFVNREIYDALSVSPQDVLRVAEAGLAGGSTK